MSDWENDYDPSKSYGQQQQQQQQTRLLPSRPNDRPPLRSYSPPRRENDRFGGSRCGGDRRENGYGDRGYGDRGFEDRGFGGDRRGDERRDNGGGGSLWGGQQSSSRDDPYRDRNNNLSSRMGGMSLGGRPERSYVPTPEPVDLFERGIPSGINFDKYESVAVNLSGAGAKIPPIQSFDGSGLRRQLLATVTKSGYEKPTPVQKRAIPIIMKRYDLMACAQTGSGKTAAFMLPLLNTLLEMGLDSRSGTLPAAPEVMIVCPTRELAIQIKNEANKFAQDTTLKSLVVYGGTSRGYQIEEVQRGVNLLIGTPGRILDFLNSGFISFSNLHALVLDEADRMLDMGFCITMQEMVRHASMPTRGKRQTLMFSATFSEDVQKIASEFLDKDYTFLTVGIVGGACADVKQEFFQVESHDKRIRLMEILAELPEAQKQKKILIFVEKKITADFLAAFLCGGEGSQPCYPATSIHGDRFQREREEALEDFRRGYKPILVATSVAARGLDIPSVAIVINYDLPEGIDDYVHRIGRTGRVGNEGRAISFYSSSQDAPLARPLVKILMQAEQEICPWLRSEAERNYNMDAAGGSQYGYGSSRYAARDVRRAPRWERGDRMGEPVLTGANTEGVGAKKPVEVESWD